MHSDCCCHKKYEKVSIKIATAVSFVIVGSDQATAIKASGRLCHLAIIPSVDLGDCSRSESMLTQIDAIRSRICLEKGVSCARQ
eukprot:scaffold674950_cov71-Prasinocladus_malaysianus.AAC.1